MVGSPRGRFSPKIEPEDANVCRTLLGLRHGSIFSENRPRIGHFLLPRTRISHAGGAVVRLCEAESQVTDLDYTGLQATG
jgi:hypothetical protein